MTSEYRHWEDFDSVNYDPDHPQYSSYIIIERTALEEGGYLYRAITYTYEGIIMSCSISHTPQKEGE